MDKAQFRKKPVVIDAIQWTGDNADPVQAFLHDGQTEAAYGWVIGRYVEIGTLEGTMTASIGDWIIRGVKGECYPCKPDIFAATYEPADQPPSASGEREAFEARAAAIGLDLTRRSPPRSDDHYCDAGTDAAWKIWQARAALAPSPGIDAAGQKPAGTFWGRMFGDSVDDTRVLWIGPMSEDEMRRDYDEFRHNKLTIAPPAAQPSERTLQEQIREAKAEVATWEPDRRDAVLLQGPKESLAAGRPSPDDHPPSRACMCTDCKPSFDNGADDPAQRYGITRGVTAASADEWMAEAGRLVDDHVFACVLYSKDKGSMKTVSAARAALLAHLRTKP